MSLHILEYVHHIAENQECVSSMNIQICFSHTTVCFYVSGLRNLSVYPYIMCILPFPSKIWAKKVCIKYGWIRCTPEGLQAMEKASEPLCSREEAVMQTKNFWSTNKEVLGKSPPSATLIPLTFFPNPLSTRSSPYKRSTGNEMLRQFLSVNNPSSQITSIWIKCP